MNFLYSLGWIISKIVFDILYRCKVTGQENLPKSGSYILAANHQSYADPPLVGLYINRPIHYIGKKELFDIPVFGWILKQVNAFPIDRSGADIGALKNALKILQNDGILLIFPEGTRYKPGKVRKLKNGAAMLAGTANLPVIPVGIINSDKLFKFKRLGVNFGPPVKFSPGEDYDTITKRIMSEVEKLKS